MPTSPPSPEPEPRDELAERLERLEAELEERLERQAAEDPLVHNPPHPGPIPEVLRERPPEPQRPTYTVNSGQNEELRSRLVRLYAIGTDFVLTALVCAGLGWAIDWFFRTSPWGLVGGIAIGVLLGGYRFIREGLAANRRAVDDLRKRRP